MVSSLSTNRLGAGRVLIAEGQQPVREQIAEQLESLDYRCRATGNAVDTITAAVGHDYQVALVDLQLDSGRGLDLIEKLGDLRPELMVIAMTTEPDYDTAVCAFRLGARDCLLKPLCLNKMREAIERCLEERRAEDDAAAAYHAMERAKEKAQASDLAKSEFLANMSHELRTPLNAIIGFSDILKEEKFGPLGAPRYQDYAQDINVAGRHLVSVITDILDIAKAEAGKLQLFESEVDLQEIVESSLRMLHLSTEAEDLQIDVDLPQETIAYFGDARKLKQILINLLSNAIKFTPEGGRISVRLALDAERGVSLSVSDTGIGIAKDDIAKALVPFVQIDGRLCRNYEGTGLGLPLVKAMAELHGGSLTLESEPDKGTCATVHLPAGRIVSDALAVNG